MDLSQIDQLAQQLSQFRPLRPEELHRLAEEFIIENTYHSNAIEGSSLTLRETAIILQQGVTIAEKPLREHLEAAGYRDAFLYVMDLAQQSAPLTEHVIQQLHALVLLDQAAARGRYRRIPVQILGASHTPPQPYLVPVQMEQLLADYADWKKDRHILEAISLFHLRFEGVHPFVDGNGRTGRLILNLELIKAGLLPVNIKFADRSRYYAAFDAYFATGQPNAMLHMIAEYEKEELEKRIKLLKEIDQ